MTLPTGHRLIIAASTAAVVAALGASMVQAQEDGAELPAGPGKEQTVIACLSCHGSGPITSEHHSGQEWQDVIDQMLEKGATGTPDQLKIVRTYLTTNYGPEAPAKTEATPNAK
jgi:hypothetical protein